MARFAIRYDCPAGPAMVTIPVDRSLVLGRDPACDIVFDDATVSRRHCEVMIRDGQARLRHLSTTNATYLNGRLIVGESALAAGDVLRIPVIEVELVSLG